MRRVGAGVFLGTALMAASPASASVTHVIAPGETLTGIAAVNGISAEAIASYNGISADTYVIEGQTIEIPAAGEVSTSSGSAATHVIQPGETLSGIAATNGMSAETVASHNGISADTYVIAGQTIEIPAASASSTVGTALGSGQIDSPWGPLTLDPAAAESWNAMADAAMAQFGIDLHPAGTLSAYRTYEQQALLYDQFLAGTGAPANPPGSSTHELGVAVDVATPEMRSVIDQIGGAYGWSGTIPSEWWHVSWGGY